MFDNKKLLDSMRWMTLASLYVFCLFSFTSFSLTAGVHILLLLPGLFFCTKYFIQYPKKKEGLPGSLWALFVLILISILSVLVNFDNGASLKGIVNQKYYLIGGVLAFFAFRELFKLGLDEKHIKKLLKIFFFTTAFASAIGVIGLYLGYNPLTGKGVHSTRASGMYGMCMTYAYGMGFVLVLSAGLILYYKKIQSYISLPWLLIATVINTVGFLLSAARGAILGVILALPLIFWEKGKRWVFAVYAIGCFCLILSIFVTDVGNKVFLQRQDSNSERLSIFKAALYATKENPVLGIGYKNFEANSQKIKLRYAIEQPKFAGNAHNNFLEYLAATGLAGFLAFTTFLLLWFKEMYFRKDYIGYIGMAFIGYLVTSGMVQYTFGDGENAFVIMTGYTFSLVIRKDLNKEN